MGYLSHSGKEISRALAQIGSLPALTIYGEERLELAGNVVLNWLNKTANYLQNEAGLMPGEILGLALPWHWRSFIWVNAAVLSGLNLADLKTGNYLGEEAPKQRLVDLDYGLVVGEKYPDISVYESELKAVLDLHFLALRYRGELYEADDANAAVLGQADNLGGVIYEREKLGIYRNQSEKAPEELKAEADLSAQLGRNIFTENSTELGRTEKYQLEPWEGSYSYVPDLTLAKASAKLSLNLSSSERNQEKNWESAQASLLNTFPNGEEFYYSDSEIGLPKRLLLITAKMTTLTTSMLLGQLWQKGVEVSLLRISEANMRQLRTQVHSGLAVQPQDLLCQRIEQIVSQGKIDQVYFEA